MTLSSLFRICDSLADKHAVPLQHHPYPLVLLSYPAVLPHSFVIPTKLAVCGKFLRQQRSLMLWQAPSVCVCECVGCICYGAAFVSLSCGMPRPHSHPRPRLQNQHAAQLPNQFQYSFSFPLELQCAEISYLILVYVIFICLCHAPIPASVSAPVHCRRLLLCLSQCQQLLKILRSCCSESAPPLPHPCLLLPVLLSSFPTPAHSTAQLDEAKANGQAKGSINAQCTSCHLQ